MNTRIAVLHIAETIGKGGGAEILVANTVTNLSEYRNIVVALYPYHTEYNLAEVPVFSFNIDSWWTFIKAIPRLRRVIKKHDIRVVHAHLFRSVLLAKLAKPRGVKLVVSIHNLLSIDLFKKSKMALILERILKNRQDAVIAVSKTVLADYLEYVPFRKKRYVLYNFVPDIFFSNSSDLNKENDKLNCLSVGHFKPQKNYPYLIASFQGLEPSKIHLDIYGEGPLENEMRWAIGKYKLKNVDIAGFSDSVSEILKQYNVFISVSEYEGFGIALLEAMAAGLVCIVSDIPVYREVAADACIFVDIANSDSLNKLLTQIINHQINISDLAAKARRRAYEISNKEKYFRELKNIYKEVIA